MTTSGGPTGPSGEPDPVRHLSGDPVTAPFGNRLLSALAARGPLCVGIDPHAALLAAWGLADDATGLEQFASTVVDALGGEVAAFKPQSAFFERHGSAGIAVLERTVAAARAAGALVVLDAKRGDIGSTAEAYADAYLHPASPLGADAVTVSPFLGFGSLRPFLDRASRYGAGVFVLTLTSNAEGEQVQRATTSSGRTVAGDLLADIGAENALAHGPGVLLGAVGAVVGATLAEVDEDLDCGGPLLVPGVGAQGASPADVARLFAEVTDRVLPAISRGVLAAGPDPAALRAAALRHRDELAGALTVSV